MSFPLPEAFLRRMQQLLPDQTEYESFIQSYDTDHYQALRTNPLKGDADTLFSYLGCMLTPVPWCSTGFYYPPQLHPGKSPYHEAGAYYIQEPSAMAPAAYLDAQPGEKILDLCAAPGGKSTQIAGAMQGQGLLISNEIHPARARILSENIERMGIPNAIVTNMAPAELSSHFPLFFDRIMVDAPCSGEGMFRKNDEAITQWSPENVVLCAKRQQEILEQADLMLRMGGRMVYSTCTFSPEEDEQCILQFLDAHPLYRLIQVPLYDGMQPGLIKEAESTIRLWPHKLHGEGHFVAVLQKGEGDPVPSGRQVSKKRDRTKSNGAISQDDSLLSAFLQETLVTPLSGQMTAFGEQIYLLPEQAPSLHGLKVLRAGLHLGQLSGKRFIPGHALALSLRPAQVRNYVNLDSSDPQQLQTAIRFIAGETFSYEGKNGWYLICIDGYSLGWGKLAGNIMKNHYPKGLRKHL
ncbi:RsmF rRNA methyltransferase first C-terminal domain-containing protein [Kineothrix sp. MSJ-39]|uniref:RsmF rRNA methyltransferase first C-terminal domain-containing protein n=1 Tax=Kineothrix sp. MSJ-39 TaxID=2841533 RepID=UPI001C0F9041|nr:RsmF rRNA methyltransferase first C-terminal domain-containing protein [Kineothrix sp. MSJ-39]MBU5430736.1 RsmF rRNA methyltransferase first C-terminal domain-containing protein [Kineothrix sp. MSJ-39]